METAEKKWEFEFDMPTNIQMANADRFKDGVDPESEAGSVVHIYGQAVAALGERLAYWQKGRTVKTTKIGDASITIDVRGVPELQEDLNRIGVRLQVAEIERGAFAGTIDNLRASLDLVDGDSLEGAVRSIKKDRDRLAKDIDSSVIGLGKSRVDRIEELEKEVSGLVRSLDHWNRETHKAEKDRDEAQKLQGQLEHRLALTIRTSEHHQKMAQRVTKELSEVAMATIYKPRACGPSTLLPGVDLADLQTKLLRQDTDLAEAENARTRAEVELPNLRNKVLYAEQTVRGQLKAIEDFKIQLRHRDKDVSFLNTDNDKLRAGQGKLVEQIAGLEDHIKELKEDAVGPAPGLRQPCDSTRQLRFGEDGETWEMCLPRKVGP